MFAVKVRVVFSPVSGVMSVTEGADAAAPIPIRRDRRRRVNTVRAGRSVGLFMEQPHWEFRDQGDCRPDRIPGSTFRGVDLGSPYFIIEEKTK
jgi:hypothetical protein